MVYLQRRGPNRRSRQFLCVAVLRIGPDPLVYIFVLAAFSFVVFPFELFLPVLGQDLRRLQV